MDDECLPEGNITKEEYMTMLEWSADDAVKANQVWLQNNKPNWIRGPLSQWQAIQNIEECRQLHLDGDKGAALYAQHLCLLDNLPPPKWLIKVLLSAYREVNHFKKRNWNDVFGEPFPKGTHLKAKRQKRQISLSVYLKALEILHQNPKTPIDEYFFECIGEEFGIKKTLVSEYYYDAEKMYPWLNPSKSKA